MNHEYSFEKLEVWQLARRMIKEIYEVTESFPDKEKFGLISQMRRSAISVSANLAEGNTRMSPKEQAHFSTIAYGSLIELLNHLIISSDLKFINEEKLVELKERIFPLTVKINNLKNSQIKRIIK